LVTIILSVTVIDDSTTGVEMVYSIKIMCFTLKMKDQSTKNKDLKNIFHKDEEWPCLHKLITVIHKGLTDH